MDNTTLSFILIVFLIALAGLYLLLRDYRNIWEEEKEEGTVLGARDERKPEVVAIENFAFNPSTLNTIPGTPIIWTNMDESTHNVRSALLNSPDLKHGDSYSFTFQSPGIYEYRCSIHPEMIGKIIVSGSGEVKQKF